MAPFNDEKNELKTPYVGLEPFSEDEEPYFFGRTAEKVRVTTNLRALPFTIFYGMSGVGKSSLLCAGVIPYLREIAAASYVPGERPEFIVVMLRDWTENPVESLNDKIAESILKILEAAKIPKSNKKQEIVYVNKSDVETVKANNDTTDMVGMLKRWTDLVNTRLLVILDQFEDFFRKPEFHSGLYSFGEEFPKAVRARDLYVHFMLSIRDDALSKLDIFSDSIPDMMRNTLRLEPLDKKGAVEAIVKPVYKFNELNQDTFVIDDDLVEKVVNDLWDEKNKKDQKNKKNEEYLQSLDTKYQIETPYLQMVMIRLWKAKETQGSKRLTVQALERMGGVQKIIDTHLDTVIKTLSRAQQKTFAMFVPFMIRPEGKNSPSTSVGLAQQAFLGRKNRQNDIKAILEKLSTGSNRIFRPVPSLVGNEESYEITHDALAPSIFNWLLRYNIQKKEAFVRVVAGAAVLCILLAATIFGTYQYRALRLAKRDFEREVKKEEENKKYLENVIEIKTQNEDLTRIARTLLGGSNAEQRGALVELQTIAAREPLSTENRSSFLNLLNESDKNQRPLDQSIRDEVNGILGQDQRQEPVYTPKTSIVFSNPDQSYAQGEIVKLIKSTGILVSLIRVDGSKSVTALQVRYFYTDDAPLALRLVNAFHNAGIRDARPNRIAGYEGKIPPKQLEVWFAPDSMAIRVHVTTDGEVYYMRSTPEIKDDNIIAKLENGTRVEKQLCTGRKVTVVDKSGTEYTGRWCKVRYNNQSGWILEPFLSN